MPNEHYKMAKTLAEQLKLKIFSAISDFGQLSICTLYERADSFGEFADLELFG